MARSWVALANQMDRLDEHNSRKCRPLGAGTGIRHYFNRNRLRELLAQLAELREQAKDDSSAALGLSIGKPLPPSSGHSWHRLPDRRLDRGQASITADAQFAPDSSLEGSGFEPSVPRKARPASSWRRFSFAPLSRWQEIDWSAIVTRARQKRLKTDPRRTVCGVTNRSSDCLSMRRSGDIAISSSRSPACSRLGV
jgi:hypothetical protein